MIAALPGKSNSYRLSSLYLIQYDPETIFLPQDEEEDEHSTEHRTEHRTVFLYRNGDSCFQDSSIAAIQFYDHRFLVLLLDHRKESHPSSGQSKKMMYDDGLWASSFH